MQTSVQTNCQQNTDSNETSMGSDSQLKEQSLQDEDNLSVPDHDGKLVIALEETEETETPATEDAAQPQKCPPNSVMPDSDSQRNSFPPRNDVNIKKMEPKSKKTDKPVRDGRKYVPSKKAMTDPLKIDMSKPLATPLSSSQISLQCIECHIIFSDHKSKERHLKQSHPAEYEQLILRNAFFACYVCDRHFTNSSELLVHQKTHTEKKPFKCPICSTTFRKLSELSVHKKVHFGQHGYTCTECGKPCKTLTLLKYHCRTHTGERPYVCKECGKRFTMPKALQKHLDSHLPEGEQPNKEGAPSVVYTCSICKATFKSTKTRLYHMKKKHNILKAALVKQCAPIITPISIAQPSLLQVGPHGPLQKVDANIDTEQIRKLIESLGNVQKVNQVVILGQVPPNAPPLEVSQQTDPVTLNLAPPQVDFMGLNERTNDTIIDPMQQTIILEPITPDGQLLHPPLSGLESNMAGNPVAEVIFQQPMGTGIEQRQTDGMVCPDNVLGHNLQTNLNQTFVLELTPALTPTAELEQSENALQAEPPPSTSVQNIEQSKSLETPHVVTPVSDLETCMSVQSLLSSVELEMLPLQADQQIVPVGTFCPQQTLLQDESNSLLSNGKIQNVPEEANKSVQHPEEVIAKHKGPVITTENIKNGNYQTARKSETKTARKSETKTARKSETKTARKSETKTARKSETKTARKSETKTVRKSETKTTRKSEKSEKKTARKSETKTLKTQVKEKVIDEVSEIPINVMSAQELVKVRKRKPPKAFFFQGHMQEFVSSIYDEFPTMTAKRKKTKKSHLVVKFGPSSNGKQAKNTKNKTSKQPAKKVIQDAPKSKREKKPNMSKKVVKSDSAEDTEVPAPAEEICVKPRQNNSNKSNKRKQKAVSEDFESQIAVASPVFKKKQKKMISPKSVKEKPETNKKKSLDKVKEKSSPQSKAESVDKSTSHVIQDSLLLLKGHKQPQLKVHKLDPLQASGKTQDVAMSENQTPPKDKDACALTETSPANKKKGGRAKKTLTLLSSLISKKQEVLPPKPTPTRKRKAYSKVETEGVITSKKSIECKECGQRFSDVSMLQNHKAAVHIMESPGITFTNGNLFEGVTRIDLYQLPKQDPKDIGLNMGWDTEPEVAELERERCVSFPALNTSPSHRKDSDECGRKAALPSPQLDDASVEDKSSTNMEGQAVTDEDVKEDLVLEVDLVTVGEQSVKDDSPQSQEKNIQNNENELAERAAEEDPTDKQMDPTSHTVSCSTHQHEIKDEEEETVIEKKNDGFKEAPRFEKPEVSLVESRQQAKQDDCEILFEKPAADSDSDDRVQINTTSEKDVTPGSVESLREEPGIRAEPEPTSTGLETQTSEDGDNLERDQSPGIVLEKVIASADKGTNQPQNLKKTHQQIKMEDSTADSTCDTCPQPQRQDIRAVLVKEESRQTPQCDGQILTQQNSNSSSPSMEALDAVVGQNCTSSQGAFYPVKEEEREVRVEPAQGSSRPASPEGSPDSHQTEQLSTNDVVFATQEVLPEPRLDDPSGGQSAESETETAPNIRDFLFQSSDEEDCTSEWTDFHVNSESEIMAHFHKGSTNCPSTAQERRGGINTKNPIAYFSKFLNWDTWREISQCTNKHTNMSSPVTAKEVSQFVGIHIAMGSLKYPSLQLYWEDLTKVPLVADSMPLSRFLELSRLLKLAYRQDNQQISKGSLANRNRHHNNVQQHLEAFNSDPLWKIQPVLKRFVRGCRSLNRQGDFGIDQYSVPLTGSTSNNKHSLYCTTLVNFEGMVLDVDFKFDPSDKEAVTEKLAPKGSMVFLCKQELSTPAMLERLLAAGSHGAGQVGGANGQIGDEFVSSDGKLMLRRAHHGFILSTAGNTERHNATLSDDFEKAQKSTLLNKKLQRLYSTPPSVFSPHCWPQTVLWFLTDLALINSWLLYKRDDADIVTPLTLLAFRLEVSKALILTSGSDAQDSLSSQTEDTHTPSDTHSPNLLNENPLPDATIRYDGLGHWPEQLSEGEGGKCRFGDCQRTSRVLCLKCCVFLCISRNHNCFKNFHNEDYQEK